MHIAPPISLPVRQATPGAGPKCSYQHLAAKVEVLGVSFVCEFFQGGWPLAAKWYPAFICLCQHTDLLLSLLHWVEWKDSQGPWWQPPGGRQDKLRWLRDSAAWRQFFAHLGVSPLVTCPSVRDGAGSCKRHTHLRLQLKKMKEVQSVHQFPLISYIIDSPPSLPTHFLEMLTCESQLLGLVGN